LIARVFVAAPAARHCAADKQQSRSAGPIRPVLRGENCSFHMGRHRVKSEGGRRPILAISPRFSTKEWDFHPTFRQK
jgi:hypothetical protein